MSTRRTLTVDEAAEILGISRGSAYEAVRQGEIPTIRIGRRILVLAPAFERMLDGDEGEPSASKPDQTQGFVP